MAERTTGQRIRAELNALIAELQNDPRDREDWAEIEALTEFRITVNRILHEAGEEIVLGDGVPARESSETGVQQ